MRGRKTTDLPCTVEPAAILRPPQRGVSRPPDARGYAMPPRQPGAVTMGNILDTLKSEHERLRELFAQIAKTADSEADARHDLLKRIESLLIPHAKWEETVFYPAFEGRASHDQKLIYAEA